jgi:polysaccharide deacetylase 2 family uncharacterized protein YibQ
MSLCKQFDKLTHLLCRILVVYILTSTGISALADKHNDAPINIDMDNNTLPANLVLILDDMGNHLASGRRALALPGAINYAFLPHTPHSITLANEAHQLNKEVLLHAPMANLRNRPIGPGALTAIMDQQQFLDMLHKDIDAVPHVRGVNNHMGSLLTQLNQPMQWMMKALQQQQLYFIDSRTTPLTIAAKQAQNLNLPSLQRDVFLDNERSLDAISIQFERALKQAKQQGFAVVIAHPYAETLGFLEQALPKLAERGIVMQLASTILAAKNCVKPLNDCPAQLKLASRRTAQ